jgi:hypothetical protein
MAVLSISLMLAPETSSACCFCDWFKCCHKEPECPAPAAACAVAPQQVNYVPQTCYRTEYTCVPCTSYKPVATCDPCGGASTVMQPVTTYVRRAVQVPYTTYRPVVTQLNYAPAAPCSACGGAGYYAPVSAPAAIPTYTAPATGCSTCGNAASVGYAPAATSYAAPAVSYAAPPATYGAPAATYGAPAASYGAPNYMPGPSMGAPAMSAPPMNAPMASPTLAPSNSMPSVAQPPSTFQPNNSNTPQDNSSLRPIQPIQPNSDAPSSDPKINSSNAPLLQDPQNRTTSLMGPAMISNAIFLTADRNNVFKPAVMENWSAAKVDDGWNSTDGK